MQRYTVETIPHPTGRFVLSGDAALEINQLKAKLSAAIVAIEFAHSEGFEWPTDPMHVIAAAGKTE